MSQVLSMTFEAQPICILLTSSCDSSLSICSVDTLSNKPSVAKTIKSPSSTLNDVLSASSKLTRNNERNLKTSNVFLLKEVENSYPVLTPFRTAHELHPKFQVALIVTYATSDNNVMNTST